MGRSLRIWTLFINIIIVNGDSCSNQLGMEHKGISDKQITASHWLHSKTLNGVHYVPNLARLNMKSASGGWCSESIKDVPNQYIQIDLLKNTKITGIATQGRGTSQEYVEMYHVTYQRNYEDVYRKYTENGTWKLFPGNTDVASIVKNTFKKPIIARMIRIYPKGDEFIIYCLRLELYGCEWGHSGSELVQYSAPFGGVRNGISMRDVTYDGNISRTDNTVRGGLGKLTDDNYGNRNLTKKGSLPWVAYNSKTPEITFEFAHKRLLQQIMFYVNNNGKDIKIFEAVNILVSSDKKKFILKKTYTSNAEQDGNIDAFAIVVNTGNIVTKYLKLRFKKKSDWLLISEIVFIWDTYSPKQIMTFPTRSVIPTFVVKLTTESPIDLVRTTDEETASSSSKGLSFPIILTIALVTVILAVIVTVIIYKSYQKKQRKHEQISSGTSTLQSAAPHQMVTSINKQQEMALMYEGHMLLQQQQMQQRMQQQQQQQQQQSLLNNGMYMHPGYPRR